MKTYTDLYRNGRDEYNGRTILVLGGGQARTDDDIIGNGRAICLMLAKRGAEVLCADRDLWSAAETVSQIKDDGGQASALQVDIEHPDSIAALFEEISLKALHGVVSNVGISDRRPFSELTAETWDRILDVNLRGHALTSNAALPLMSERGAFVFISSLAATMPVSRNPAYECSKAALEALSRSVAVAGHAKGIRSNVVRAGVIDTPMGRAASRVRSDRLSGGLPFGRQGTGWEIASATCFLLSPQASYVNAIELTVDGGYHAGITLPEGQSVQR